MLACHAANLWVAGAALHHLVCGLVASGTAILCIVARSTGRLACSPWSSAPLSPAALSSPAPGPSPSYAAWLARGLSAVGQGAGKVGGGPHLALAHPADRASACRQLVQGSAGGSCERQLCITMIRAGAGTAGLWAGLHLICRWAALGRVRLVLLCVCGGVNATRLRQ